MHNHQLIVIGGGAAGLTVAEIAATLGIDVALVEGAHTGGDCTWYGCMPSKTLINVAKTVHHARTSQAQGIDGAGVTVDFAQVMTHIQATIEAIYADETPAELRQREVTVYEAYAHFTDPHTLQLESGETLRAERFVLATGSRPRVLDGFDDVPYLTNHTLFDLREQPDHLLIVGGGPIGTEMAQAFNRLGTQVTLIEYNDHILPRDDPDASELIAEILSDEGVTLMCGQTVERAEYADGRVTVHLADGTAVSGSHVLLAVGRVVDVRNLNPDAAGIAHEDGRLLVDDRLQTNQAHIFAAGDVAGGQMLSHASSTEGTTALFNALLPLKSKRKTHLPWATFTDPEVAHAGLTEAQVRQHHPHYEVTRLPITRVDRAMTAGHRRGFMKLIHGRYGKLYGATIVGPNAGEMMNEWAAIIERGGRVHQATLPVKIYPTLGTSNAVLATEHLRKIAAETRIGALVRRVLKWIT
jgi:pyruvate/2-oxoglutarate dehydrogenase complex dihydrolipoamide dehydrogenase (E3) component